MKDSYLLFVYTSHCRKETAPLEKPIDWAPSVCQKTSFKINFIDYANL